MSELGESDQLEDVELFDIVEGGFRRMERSWMEVKIHGPGRMLEDRLIYCYQDEIPSVLPMSMFWEGKSETRTKLEPQKYLEAGWI